MNRHTFNRLVATTAAAAVTALALPGCSIRNGTGNYVGTVSRIQTDGIFDMCKTWEGEIAAISIRGRQGAGSTMHFTAKEAGIATQLEDAMNKQYPVRIEFTDTANPWPCSQGSRDVVTKVEKLDTPLNSPFGGKAMENDESTAMSTVSPTHGSKKVFICTEAEAPAPHTATQSNPVTEAVPAPAVASPGNKLPQVLQLHN